MSGKTRKNRPGAGRPASDAPSSLARQDSASQGKWSNDVIGIVESGTVDEIRGMMAAALLNSPESLLTQSMRNEHGLRTPLMAAAASGDYALFTTVMHAVDSAIDIKAGGKFTAAELATEQLRIKDNWGMTLTMIAAETGNVPLIKTMLRRIRSAKDYERLIDTDYRGNTVLMHAAGAGKSATFEGFLAALQQGFPEKEVDEQLQERSGNGWNLLMHAARCGDQLGVLAVINACKTNLSPSKVRHLVEHTDGDGMSVLMHAASCSQTGAAAAARRAAAMAQRGEIAVDPQQTSTQATADPSAPGSSSRAGGVPPFGRFPGIAEEEEEEEQEEEKEKEDVEIGAPRSPEERSLADDALHGLAGKFGFKIPKKNPFASLMGQQEDEEASVHSIGSRRRRKEMSEDPGLVVFKTVWEMVKGVLWKEQLRKQLKLTDTWGRNILIHAVQSGRIHVFEAAFSAMREHILDPETNKLMNVDDEDNLVSAMEAALEEAPRDMVQQVKRRDQELKKQIAQDERASTIEAKMQSFIPGKLIVIFQLLLPEIGNEGGNGTGPLVLLLLLTLGAPFLTWATNLISRDKPFQAKDARQSQMTNLLSAPAIFFWGLGTSDIAEISLGWSKTSSAAALAVATIVIPGLDAFFANQRVEQWWDKWSGQSLRYATKANMAWQKEQKKERKTSKERRRRSIGEYPDSRKKGKCRGLCQSLEATGVADMLANPPSSEALLGYLGDGKDELAGEMQERGRAFGADANKQLQDATTGAASRLSHVAPAEALFGYMGDGKDQLAGAMQGGERAFAAGTRQLQDATAGVADTLAHAPSQETLRGSIGDGRDQLGREMKGAKRAFAAGNKQLQDATAGVADSLAHAPSSEVLRGYLGDGKDLLDREMKGGKRAFAAGNQQLQGATAGVAASLSHAPDSEALLGYLGDGKDQLAGAMQDKGRAIAADSQQLQEGATAAVADTLARLPSQESLLADGKDLLAGAVKGLFGGGGSSGGDSTPTAGTQEEKREMSAGDEEKR